MNIKRISRWWWRVGCRYWQLRRDLLNWIFNHLYSVRCRFVSEQRPTEPPEPDAVVRALGEGPYSRYSLRRGHSVLATLVEYNADFPWIYCHCTVTPAFEAVRPEFEEFLEYVECSIHSAACPALSPSATCGSARAWGPSTTATPSPSTGRGRSNYRCTVAPELICVSIASLKPGMNSRWSGSQTLIASQPSAIRLAFSWMLVGMTSKPNTRRRSASCRIAYPAPRCGWSPHAQTSTQAASNTHGCSTGFRSISKAAPSGGGVRESALPTWRSP